MPGPAEPRLIGDYDATEFTDFMRRYLLEHPEVVEDQRRGWNIHWSPGRAGPEDPGTPPAEHRAGH